MIIYQEMTATQTDFTICEYCNNWYPSDPISFYNQINTNTEEVLEKEIED